MCNFFYTVFANAEDTWNSMKLDEASTKHVALVKVQLVQWCRYSAVERRRAALSCWEIGGAICMLKWEAVLGMPIATRLELLYTTYTFFTDYFQPACCYYKYTPQEPFCIQPQVCSTVNTTVVTALCIIPSACCDSCFYGTC